MSLASQVERHESTETNGAAKSGSRLDRLDALTARKAGSHVDAALIAELLPAILAATILAAAVIAKGCDLVTGSGLAPAWPSALGIGCLASLIGYWLFREAGRASRQWGEAISISRPTSAVVLLGVAGLLLIVLVLLDSLADYRPAFLGLWGATALALDLSLLTLAERYRRMLNADSRLQCRIAIFGRGEALRATRQHLENAVGRTVLAGVYEDEPSGKPGDNSSSLDELAELARNGGCDRVVLGFDLADEVQIKRAFDKLSSLPIPIQLGAVPQHLNLPLRGVERRGSLILLSLQEAPLGPGGRIVKAVLDYTLATIAGILLAPVLLLIAIAIKLDSSGPVLFVQPRGGYRQKAIRVYKFRTMNVLETGSDVKQARRNDPRVTRVGKFLRRTSLDELPQLLNVLKGELSLVGPRPHALAHDLQYGAVVEQYAHRHKIKPGITGWAQVNGYRSQTEDNNLMRERVKYDLYYIDHWSLWFDLKILIRTVGVLFGDKQAY
ncbi:MAG: exopolysaccharide biosynthesis polyprenyl glycosylphosphotransferase [Hyphomicrobiaceae bacterium]